MTSLEEIIGEAHQLEGLDGPRVDRNRFDSIARWGALSITRHDIPSWASSWTIVNPVGPAPTISTFGLSLIVPSTFAQRQSAWRPRMFLALASLREILDPLLLS